MKTEKKKVREYHIDIAFAGDVVAPNMKYGDRFRFVGRKELYEMRNGDELLLGCVPCVACAFDCSTRECVAMGCDFSTGNPYFVEIKNE